MKVNIKLLKELCKAFGVSGDEGQVRDIIKREIKDFADEISVDPIGNLIVFKKGKKKAPVRLMICAHMDEVGFIVTDVTSEGYLNFETVGGIDKSVIHGINVKVGFNGIAGVIGTKPIHLLESQARSSLLADDGLMIDIGAKDRKQALEFINIGDTVSFRHIFNQFNSKIQSKALDDRAGCAVLIEMIKSELEYDTFFAFTVQEEIGLRGAAVATYSIKPQAALIIESTTANDVPGVKPENRICELGRGPAISFMDKRTVYDKEYYKLAMDIAEENNINVQAKKGVTGGNDAGAVHISRDGVRTIALSVPARYIHSPSGMLDYKDLDNTLKLACLLCRGIGGGSP